MRSFFVIIFLLATFPFTALALNQSSNWSFTGDSTNWTATNGTATDVCGATTSTTEDPLDIQAFDNGTTGTFKAGETTTLNNKLQRGRITQGFTMPGSGNQLVTGGFTYATYGSVWSTADTSWVRLDVYDSADSVFQGNLGCVSFNTNLATTTAGFTNRFNLTGGTTYKIRVTQKLRNVSPDGVQNVWVDNIVVTTPPVGVSTSTVPATTTPRILWTASTATATAPAIHATTPYKVYRGTSSGGETFLGNATTSQFEDYTVAGNTLYYYWMTNLDTSSYESASSTETSMITQPDIPGTPTFSSITENAMTVSWAPPAGGSAGATSTLVERCTGSGCTSFSTIASGVTNLFYNDSGLSGGTVYRYRISVTNGTGYGGTAAAEQSTSAPATPPTVTAQAASLITTNTATLNGTIENNNGASSTLRGFAWGTNANLSGGDTATTSDTAGQPFNTGTFTAAINNLTCNVTYYFRPYAVNTAGTSTVAIASFVTTACTPPTVTSQAASSITQTTVTLNGTITNNNGASSTLRGFAWGTNAQLSGGDTATTSDTAGAPFNTGAFTGALSSLTCATTYYFRPYAVNIVGTSTVAISSFNTSACASPPTVTTQSATAVTATTATLNGNITATGGANAVSRGFAWGTNAQLSGGDTATTSENGDFGTGAFTNTSLTLVCNTTYYSRAYAANIAGTSTGAISASFTTTACPPTVTTQSATAVATTTATLNGNITATGGANAVSRGFAWGTNANLSGGDTATTSENGDFGTGAFTNISLTLVCNTTYYSRAYAANSAGTSTGAISASFLTSPCAPTVTTQSASSITTNAATLNGNITATGGTNATVRGFAWGTNAQLSGGDTATTSESGSFGAGAFTGSLTNLTCNTTYYSRAYALNYAGTSTGAISASFTTSACTPPTVTTSTTVDSIAQTTATLNGNVTATGGANATEHGFAYGTDATLASVIATTTGGGFSGTGAFTSSSARNISGLSCSITYYYRAYGTNLAGTGFGSIQSFLTSPCAPTVTTQSASSVTSTTATLNGNITATGGANATMRGFAYGTDATLATVVATTTESGSFGTGAYTGAISSLTCGATYYSRAYAVNSAGTSTGAISASFTTSNCAPTVTTQAASGVGTNDATLNGTITVSGGANATVRGFAYGTDATLATVIATTTENGSFSTGAFTGAASSLACNTTYYSRAYATNPAGTGIGGIQSFTTSLCDDTTVTTQAASSITQTSAILNGNITATGGANATVRGFTWGTNANLSGGDTATTTEAGSFGVGAFTGNISSLTCNTLYYSRAYAVNIVGTSTGSTQSFTSSACNPTVTTQSASSVAQTTATLNGTITATGGANATTRGFAWGTNAQLSGGDTATTSENGDFGTGAFTGAISSLTCNTTYYSRAYAANSAGTSTGAISTSFTTSACSLPTVTTQSPSGVTQTTATLNGTITATGGANATTRGFAWGTNANLSGGDTATTTESGSFGTGAFTGAVSSLTCDTTYYSRAYATNVAGTSQGTIASFTTTSCAPPSPAGGGSYATTLGGGIDPSSAIVLLGAFDQDLDHFTFVTNAVADTVTALRITTTNSQVIASMKVMSVDSLVQYFATQVLPAGDNWEFSGGSAIPVVSIGAEFVVLVSLKERSLLANGDYAVTGFVSSFTSNNSQSGSDAAGTTLTVINQQPGAPVLVVAVSTSTPIQTPVATATPIAIPIETPLPEEPPLVLAPTSTPIALSPLPLAPKPETTPTSTSIMEPTPAPVLAIPKPKPTIAPTPPQKPAVTPVEVAPSFPSSLPPVTPQRSVATDASLAPPASSLPIAKVSLAERLAVSAEDSLRSLTEALQFAASRVERALDTTLISAEQFRVAINVAIDRTSRSVGDAISRATIKAKIAISIALRRNEQVADTIAYSVSRMMSRTAAKTSDLADKGARGISLAVERTGNTIVQTAAKTATTITDWAGRGERGMVVAIKTSVGKLGSVWNGARSGASDSIVKGTQLVVRGTRNTGDAVLHNVKPSLDQLQSWSNTFRDLALRMEEKLTPASKETAPSKETPMPEDQLVLRSGKLELVGSQDKPIQTIIGFKFTSEIKPSKPATSITDTFKYTGPDERGVWTAEGQMPEVSGAFTLGAKISYADGGVNHLKVTTLIDPMGYVYEKTSRGELRIADAKVTLMEKRGDAWLPWAAEEYGQQNPQTTDRTGQYSFLAPAGEYSIHIERAGYAPFTSEVLPLEETSPINLNIEMHYLGTPM